MKFQFWSVGKPHEDYVKKGIEDFTRRINNYYSAEWMIIPPPKHAASLPGGELKKQEAKLILNKLRHDDFLALLDEKTGRQLNSEEFAEFLSKQASANTRLLIFLIGGAFGVDEEIKQRADFTWSLSKLVFPHMLARLILAEQVYRACSILRNEKYHHA